MKDTAEEGQCKGISRERSVGHVSSAMSWAMPYIWIDGWVDDNFEKHIAILWGHYLCIALTHIPNGSSYWIFPKFLICLVHVNMPITYWNTPLVLKALSHFRTLTFLYQIVFYVFPFRNSIFSVDRMARNLPIPQKFNKVMSHKERVDLLCFRTLMIVNWEKRLNTNVLLVE